MAVAGAEVRAGWVEVVVVMVVMGVGALEADELPRAAAGCLDEDFGLHRAGGGPGSWSGSCSVVFLGLAGFGVGALCSEWVWLPTRLPGLFAGV